MSGEIVEQNRVRVPFRTVLASIAGLWLCYFVLTTLRSELLDLGFTFEMLWRRALASFAGIVITLGLWLVLRLFDARPLWMKITAALLLSLPAAPLIVQKQRAGLRRHRRSASPSAWRSSRAAPSAIRQAAPTRGHRIR